MKLLFCLGVLLLSLVGCIAGPQARVVRVMLSTNSPNWYFSVDRTGIPKEVSSNNLTNMLTHLYLRQGDAIVFGSTPLRDRSAASGTWDWIGRYCDSNNVAMYLYGVDSSPAGWQVFSIPAYHWTAPFNYPLKLTNASFFYEGTFLGKEQKGYDSMLNKISQTRPRKVFILGSLYNINRSLPPMPNPFESQRDRLDSVLKAARTEFIEMDILPGF